MFNVNLLDFDILRFSGVVIVFLLMLSLTIYYNFSIKKIKYNEVPKGLAFLIFNLINYFRNLTRDILGKDLEKLSPIFLTIFVYILFSNLIGMFGVDSPTSSIWICLTFGFFTFVGTFVIGFRYQRFSFLYKFTFNIKIKSKEKDIKIPLMINPIEIMSAFTPIISLSFRLWGNIFAGILILSLVYNLPKVIFTGEIDQLLPTTPLQHPITLISILFTPPLHAFFDLGIGTIQALVFILLTMVYWTLNKQGH